MNKELFKALVSKMASQDSLATFAEVLSESEAFSPEEFDNIIAMLAGAYTVPVIKESANPFINDQTDLTFKSFNKVRMRVRYTYKPVKKLLEHKGEFLTKWEAERKGLAEEFKASAIDKISEDVCTDCCSYETWAKYQHGNTVGIEF